MYASVDKAVDRLRRQLVKFKDQLADVKVRGGVADVQDGEDAERKADKQIIRTETHFFKPMTPEEAALQLEAIEKGFLVFVDADTDQVAIIYHRRDGNYGLIEPRR
jgi:putative sigma-54 modulation protein